MGTPDRQDDHLLTIPGLAEADKIAVCKTITSGRGVAYALAQLGRFMDDLDRALMDPEFAREYHMALRLRDEKVESALHRKATRGNVTAMRFWLTNRQPENWAETRTLRHVGHGGGAIEVEHTVSALRQVLTSGETRDDAIAWIERDADIIDVEADDSGELTAGEDQEPGETG